MSKNRLSPRQRKEMLALLDEIGRIIEQSGFSRQELGTPMMEPVFQPMVEPVIEPLLPFLQEGYNPLAGQDPLEWSIDGFNMNL